MPWDVTTQNHLKARAGYKPRWLLYVDALETDKTSAPMGLWTGEYDATFVIDGQSRLYYGMGDSMKVDQLIYETGTRIRTQRIALSGVRDESQELVRGRIIRGRRAEIHLMFLDPLSEAVIGYNRMFKGLVDRAPISRGAFGKTSSISIELMSFFALLERTVGLKKSDESQKARNGDRGRRYGSIAAQVKTEWSRE